MDQIAGSFDKMDVDDEDVGVDNRQDEELSLLTFCQVDSSMAWEQHEVEPQEDLFIKEDPHIKQEAIDWQEGIE
jgi:hypothetical protein